MPEDAEIERAMSERVSGGGGAADPTAIGHHGHTRQFADVLDAIREGRQPQIDGTEGRRSVEIILGIYLAAETGEMVRLPLETDPVLKARETGVGGQGG
jgi:predicted dehydrogenase